MISGYSNASAIASGPPRTATKEKWGAIEWYLLALLLGSGLVFLPGSSFLRAPIRSLPYTLSLALLGWHLLNGPRQLPAGAKLIVPAMLLYVANLAHPLTAPVVGLATVVFHISIIGPALWAPSKVRGTQHVQKLLWIVFLASVAHVVMGLLQTAFPFTFMPPQIAANPEVLAQQTYIGPFGQMMIRPPGLTDLPGGASNAGTLAAVLGVAYLLRPGERASVRLLGLTAALGGLAILYLTQVRVFAVLTVLALGLFVSIAFLQDRGRALVMGGMGAVVLAILAGMQRGFGYDPSNPYAPGGRFQELIEQGLFGAWIENRGRFFRQTMEEYVWEYPLGAGLGRWGMMREYFGSGTPFSSIWVEIQPTGWLLDGGIPMWIFYGGAVIAAMVFSARVALQRDRGDLAYFAAIVLALQAVIAGSSMAGPVFSTIFGILFWLLTGVLYAAADRQSPAGQERSVQRMPMPGLSP